ncbi:cation transporter [Candidatus Nitrosocosmicus agrestis]|uniref:cation transporter n=1 Tax=Candidatus Nitrosocosmicus agrestis TaxID=2563600 RepID=UPI00122E59C2|nr:cation transporter [Candidatus Nitrosocosmicus sp. SS]KAA2282953.1 hypothetical protein F1Z66_04625 [Candidatus Nitrosocosmicus sp. SS]KAF0869156.1 hypothetical protein E5N71_06905 [Candidatus Nitrosocosmicus sp. SS]
MSKYLAFEEGKKAAWSSIWTLLGIGVAEVVISTTTGSLTLLADGLDSLADSLVSFIVWFGITMIQKPKSKLFHYGYGKIESFAAFIAAIIVIILGIFICLSCLRKNTSSGRIYKSRNHYDYITCSRCHITS